MIRNTVLVGLGLFTLLLSGCTPTIDSSSQEKYEQSLVAMSKGLSTGELSVLTQAVSIVQGNTKDNPLLSREANDRNKLSGMTREQIVNKAKSTVLDWFAKNKNYIDNYCKADELAKGVSISVGDSKKRDDYSGITYVSVRVKNGLKEDIEVGRLKIDDFIFLDRIEKNNQFRVAAGSSTVLNGFLICFDHIPIWITFASVNGLQIIPNVIHIPAGYSEFLTQVGVEMQPCSYRSTAPAPTASKNP